MKVIIQQLRPWVGDVTPTRGSVEAAGYDVRYAGIDPIRVWPNEVRKIPLGIALEVPVGYYTLVTSRSSALPTLGLHIAEGKIDSDYRGEIFATVLNVGREAAILSPLERVAQIIFKKHEVVQFREGVVTPSQRGAAGFGSTGRV